MLKTRHAKYWLSGALISLAIGYWASRKSDQNVRVFVRPDATEAVKKGLSRISLEQYSVPNIFRNSWIQLALLLLCEQALQKPRKPSERQELVLPHSGGDNVILDWFLPEKLGHGELTPIIVYCPGITGGLPESLPFMECVLRKGWIGIVFHRRGHESPLKRPTFNLFGNALDLRAAIEENSHTKPGAPIGMVGSSAGSALTVRYIGQFGADTRVVAGVGLSPGYSLLDIWKECQGSFFDHYLLGRIKGFFVTKYKSILIRRSPEFVKRLEDTTSMYDLVTLATVFSSEHHEGIETIEEYGVDEWLHHTCPNLVAQKIQTPMICLNALDDPICTRKFVESRGVEIANTNKHCAMIVTNNGTHCAHQSFHNGRPENWGYIVALNFIEGVIESK